MFSFIGGRMSQRGQPVLLYFAFVSGEVKSTNKSSSCSTISQRQRFKITTAVSGFAKPKNGKVFLKPKLSGEKMEQIPASILHGKVGEDAYFRAHYAGELCEDKSGTRKDMIIFSAHNFKKKLNFLQTTFKSAQTTKFYKIST